MIDKRENSSDLPNTGTDQLLDDIKYMLDITGETIFVECVGKDKLEKKEFIEHLERALNKRGMGDYYKRIKDDDNRERDGEYYHSALRKCFNYISNDITYNENNKHGKLIIYDKGVLDLFTWLEYDKNIEMFDEDYVNEIIPINFSAGREVKHFPLEIKKNLTKFKGEPPLSDGRISENLERLLELYSPFTVVFFPDYHDEVYDESLKGILSKLKIASLRCIRINDGKLETINNDGILNRLLVNIREFLLNNGVRPPDVLVKKGQRPRGDYLPQNEELIDKITKERRKTAQESALKEQGKKAKPHALDEI